MPILGLFNTGQEDRYARQVGGIASGQQTSAAVKDLQSNANQMRKQAFSQAYQSRGNPALAQRQAAQVAGENSLQAGAQIASQRARDVQGAQQEQTRLAAQTTDGINNAIGMGAQAVGTLYGGPMGGAAAKTGSDMLTGAVSGALSGKPEASGQGAGGPLGDLAGGVLSSLGQSPAGQTMAGPETQSLLGAPSAPTAPSQAGQAALGQALSGGNQAPAYDNKPSAEAEAAQVARQKDALMRSHPSVIDPNDPRWQNKQRLLFQQMAGR